MKLSKKRQYEAAMEIRRKLIQAIWTAPTMDDASAFHRAAKLMSRRTENLSGLDTVR